MKKGIKDKPIYTIALFLGCLLSILDILAGGILKKGPMIIALVPVSTQVSELIYCLSTIVLILGLIVLVTKIIKKEYFNAWAILGIAKFVEIISLMTEEVSLLYLLVSVLLLVVFTFLAIVEKKTKSEKEIV